MTTDAMRDAGFTVEEQIIARLARAFDIEGVACSATICGDLATRLAKALYAPQLLLISGHNGFDAPVRPKLLDEEQQLNPVSVCASDWQQTFDLVGHQRYAVCVGPVQVDRTGCANISLLGTDWGRPTVQLIGSRGLPDHAANTRDGFLLHVRRHSPRVFVERVDFRASSPYDGPLGRTGVPRVVVSDLGVLVFDPDAGQLVVESLHLGVTFDEIQAATGFALPRRPMYPVTEPPTAEELEWLRHRLDPLGMLRMEKEGLGPELLDELLAAERAHWVVAPAQR